MTKKGRWIVFIMLLLGALILFLFSLITRDTFVILVVISMLWSLTQSTLDEIK
jgi:hypothetical protein